MGKIEQIRQIIADPFVGFDNLNAIERQVLRLASRGYTNVDIADEMKIGKSLVEYYLRNGLLKINRKKKDLPEVVFTAIEDLIN